MISLSTVGIRIDVGTAVFPSRNSRMIETVLKVEFLDSSREMFDFVEFSCRVQVDIDVVAKVFQYGSSGIYYNNFKFKNSSSTKEDFRR